MSTARSASKEALPKRSTVPQNGCYQTSTRKGGPVTERARREYAEAVRARYRVADKRERGRILDEYCRTTGCHRKAAIRRHDRGGSQHAEPDRQLPVVEEVDPVGA